MKQSLFIKQEIENLNQTIFLLEEKVRILEKENNILKKQIFKREGFFSKVKNFLNRVISIEIIFPTKKVEKAKENTVREDYKKAV